MVDILNRPILQEYIGHGQSKLLADPTDYVDENGQKRNIGI